jgi:hypothetical protein
MYLNDELVVEWIGTSRGIVKSGVIHSSKVFKSQKQIHVIGWRYSSYNPFMVYLLKFKRYTV